MIKKTYRIPEMHCPNCVMLLEGLEDSLDGIKRVSASYHKLQMQVIFDETILNEETLIAEAKKLGYTAIPE